MAVGVFGEDLQRAAFEPDGWPDILHRISHGAGALGAILISEAHLIPVPPISRDLKPLMERYYGEGWNTRDLRFRGIGKAVRTGAVTDGDVFTIDEMRTAPYYQELLRPEGCQWFCSLAFRVAGELWFLTVQRTIEQEPFGRDEVARLKVLRRPLEAAAGLSHALSFARVSGMADAFERLAKPAIVLDERGLMIRCNAEAERVIGALASIRHREIGFHGAENQRNFDAALAQAGFAAQWSGSLRNPTVLRHADGRTWDVKATALGDWARYTFVQASYLVILEESREDPSSATRWRTRYALTPAEGRLAESLAAGLSLRAIAERHAITYQTARTHLKAVLAKTGVHRQSELVSLLLRGKKDDR